MMSQSVVIFRGVGESVQLNCTFNSARFNLFDNPVRWLKSQNSKHSVQMNLMGNVLDPFSKTGRFRVTLLRQPPLYSFLLEIMGTFSEA